MSCLSLSTHAVQFLTSSLLNSFSVYAPELYRPSSLSTYSIQMKHQVPSGQSSGSSSFPPRAWLNSFLKHHNISLFHPLVLWPFFLLFTFLIISSYYWQDSWTRWIEVNLDGHTCITSQERLVGKVADKVLKAWELIKSKDVDIVSACHMKMLHRIFRSVFKRMRQTF